MSTHTPANTKLKTLDADYWAKRKALDDDYWAKRQAMYGGHWATREALGDPKQPKQKGDA